MGRHVNYAGLVIAGIGFFLTRFTVTLAIYEDPVRFYLAGVVPLALGLGLAAFGIALAVADVEASLVRTTALWCVAGAGAMLILVVLTLLGSSAGGMPAFETMRSQTYLSNFLIGGSVGGTLTGLYASRNRRQRTELRQQTYRLAVLNRLLRHEILNAVTVIRGYATITGEEEQKARSVIEEHSNAIEQTIEEVKYLTRSASTSETAGDSIDLAGSLAKSVEGVRDRHSDATISVGSLPENLPVRANERAEQVFVHLLENAVVHTADDATVEVSVTESESDVRVSVRDEGLGLPESQRALLERGEIEEFDDPGSGFGLNVVRLLVESYGGSIETDVDERGTTVTVALRRAEPLDTGLQASQSGLVGVRPAIPHLVVTLGAALLAGVVFGIVAEQFGGSVSGIGVYYGTTSPNPVVGWFTHEFHSVVFAFVFAGLVSMAPPRYRTRLSAHVTIGAGWGVVLWLLAAGIVSPIWLQLLGIPASIPSLSTMTFATHLAWGVSLGLFTAWGYMYVTPRLTRLGGRLGRGPVRA